MRIFLTGGTSLIGRSVLRILLNQGHSVTAAVPCASFRKLADHKRLNIIVGDLRQSGRWQNYVANSDVILHLDGLERGHPNQRHLGSDVSGTERLIDAALSGVARPRRLVCLTSLGSNREPESPVQRTVWAAEEAVRDSGLEHLILRPSWIFGSGDTMWERWIRLIRFLPVVPIVGSPELRVQPVALANVVEGIVKAIRLPMASSRVYDIAGPRIYSLQEVVNVLAKTAAKPNARRWYISGSAPNSYRWLPMALRIHPPWDAGAVCNPIDYYRDFCIRPIRFEETESSFIQTRSETQIRPTSH